jgi:hypothetical protein
MEPKKDNKRLSLCEKAINGNMEIENLKNYAAASEVPSTSV